MSSTTNQQRLRVFKTWLDDFHARLKRKGKFNSKRKFTTQDEMVPWKRKYDNQIFYRYYHLFKSGEIEKIIPDNVEIVKSFFEKSNWCIIIKKLKLIFNFLNRFNYTLF